MNCFRKSGISSKSREADIVEDGNSFQKLQDQIDKVCYAQSDLFAENIGATSRRGYWSSAVQTSPTDAEIAEGLLQTEDVSDDDNSVDVEIEPVECPYRNKLLQVIKTLQRISLFTDKRDTIQSYANHIGGQIDWQFAQKEEANYH